jgi:hypothetical protein
MDTNELVGTLAKDLKPVKPLASPAARALRLSLIAPVLALSLVPTLGGPRADWLEILQNPRALAPDLIILAAGVLAACAAAALAVPDVKIRRGVRILLVLATALWIGVCAGAAATLSLADVEVEWGTLKASASCVRGLVLMTAFPLLIGFVMTLKGAPVWRGWSGYAVTLSMASFGAFAMRFLCPSDAPSHLLLWHFMPVVVVALLGTLLGKAILRFK